jgi:hypothetical protein
VRGGGDHFEPLFARERRDDGAEVRDVRARLLYVVADARADLDHRLDHLRLDLLAEEHLPFLKHLRDVRTQLARLRIDDLKFFFDAKRILLEHKFSLSLQDLTWF